MRELLLLLLAMPITTYTPQQLLEPREIAYSCTENVCTLKKEDLEFLQQQNVLLGNIAIHLVNQCKSGQRSI